MDILTVRARNRERALELYERHVCNALALAVLAEQQISEAPLTARSAGPSKGGGAGRISTPYDSNIYICRVLPLHIILPAEEITTDVLIFRVSFNGIQAHPSKWHAFTEFRGDRFHSPFRWKGGTNIIFQYHVQTDSFQLSSGISGDLRAAFLHVLRPHRDLLMSALGFEQQKPEEAS